MAIQLSDDGTMDTVLVCSECGREFRFTYDSDSPNASENTVEQDEPGGYWRVRYHGQKFSAGYLTEQAAQHELNTMLYDDWVNDCIKDTTEEHECGGDW